MIWLSRARRLHVAGRRWLRRFRQDLQPRRPLPPVVVFKGEETEMTHAQSLFVLMVLAVAFPTPAWAQDKPADNMQILRKMAFQGPGRVLRLHPLFCGQRIAERPGRGNNTHFFQRESAAEAGCDPPLKMLKE